MDRELQTIRNALTDKRVAISHQFQKMTQLVDKNGFAMFLVVYCRQAAGLAQWMSEWNDQIRQDLAKGDQEQIASVFESIAERLSLRRHALDQDLRAVTQWAGEYFARPISIDTEVTLSSGIKQLRYLSSECSKRKFFMSWLLVMTELERLRIVHGFTLIKMCELFFGKSVLRCFSHIHYQHQNQNELFSICESALEANVSLHKASIPTMIADVRKAIEAYACFIQDCYQMSIKQVPDELESTAK